VIGKDTGDESGTVSLIDPDLASGSTVSCNVTVRTEFAGTL